MVAMTITILCDADSSTNFRLSKVRFALLSATRALKPRHPLEPLSQLGSMANQCWSAPSLNRLHLHVSRGETQPYSLLLIPSILFCPPEALIPRTLVLVSAELGRHPSLKIDHNEVIFDRSQVANPYQCFRLFCAARLLSGMFNGPTFRPPRRLQRPKSGSSRVFAIHLTECLNRASILDLKPETTARKVERRR